MDPSDQSGDDSAFDPLKFARRGRGTERREFPRHRVQTPALLTVDGLKLAGKLEDIGAGGVSFLAIDVEADIAPATLVQLSIEDEGGTIEKSARVLRVEDYFDGEHDVLVLGLAFEEPLE